MIAQLENLLSSYRKEIYLLLRRYVELGRPLLLRSDLVDLYDAYCATEPGTTLGETAFSGIIRTAQEAVIRPPLFHLALRHHAGTWNYVRIHAESLHAQEIDVSAFLQLKEGVVDRRSKDNGLLEVDLAPFERGFPKLKETRSIGKGVEFLNRHLSSRLFDEIGRGDQKLFEFLRLHHVRGRQLMLNAIIETLEQLREALRRAEDFLQSQATDTEWKVLEPELKRMGFEAGWGLTAALVQETMNLLTDILEAPSPEALERFLRRIPMIFTILIISPHGYLGQSGVLGRPDTGGQVVYILDQVRALERAMLTSIHEQGLDVQPRILVLTRLIPEADGTTCDQRIEPILGTEHARILRVPFRDEAGEIVPQWISRFKIWPYLERFAREAQREVVAELGERPDFLIGNYSDGNLVASILSRRLGVTQCNIAHALEKTKYLHSELYWQQHEEEHHFACQFTADLISMNTADFIITSTYQEIAGTKTGVGQYESYQAFTMPSLYRVTSGVDVFDPKFNIVSPGADPDVFFPYHHEDRRLTELHDEIRDMIYGKERSDARGSIHEPGKPLLFAMSRLDHIKNMSGLVDWFGRSPELREEANLFLVGGHVDPDLSDDREERRQIETMHRLLDEHGLDGHVRWIVMQSDKTLVGELYRFVADTRGAFIQPALFEAFGLTVIEAMTCGLPTFATCYGGPLESIEHGVSGFHMDPNHGQEAAVRIAEFLRKSRDEPEAWERISRGAIDRVDSHYTWKRYADRLLALSRIYGFWKYITDIERMETGRYLEMFFGLMYRPLAERVLNSHS